MKTYKDPVTGDELNTAEHISWRLQSIIRNWYFIGAITTATIIVSIIGRAWAFPLMEMWNFSASYLALFIESIVGIAMFSQTRRDAVKIRKIEALEEKIEHMISAETVIDTKTYDLVAYLVKNIPADHIHKGDEE